MAPNIVSSKNCFENKIKIKRNNNIKKVLEVQNFIKITLKTSVMTLLIRQNITLS